LRTKSCIFIPPGTSLIINNRIIFTTRQILLLFLLFINGSILFSQTKVYGIEYSGGTTIIDGDISDWDTTGITTFKLHKHNTPEDIIAKVKFAWDEIHFFALFIINDQNFVKHERGNNNPRLYFNDGIELYIDSKNNSPSRMDVDDYQFLVDLEGEQTIFKGDKQRITGMDSVPKEFGTANILLNCKTMMIGTVNKFADNDSMFIAELSVAWESIGIIPKVGYKFKVDACVNDLDSLVNLREIPENQPVPKFFFSSWQRSNDFGNPAIWQEVILTGSPDFVTILSRKYSRTWLFMFFVSIIISIGIVSHLGIRIKKLKQIPTKVELRHSLLTEILQDKPVTKQRSPHDNLFNEIKLFVLDNLQHNTRPEQLADKTNMSLRQIQRIFKDELNTTPGGFIALIKLEKAAELLIKTDKNITQVAYEVGFSDSSYFAQVFKKYFNISPKEFIKANRLN
jgi:AraC-like DNA-binding protein